MHHAPIIEFLFTVLFATKLTPQLIEQSKSIPKDPIGYSKRWSFLTPWDLHKDLIRQKYLVLLNVTEDNTSSLDTTVASSNTENKEEANSEEEKKAGEITPEIEEEYKSLTMCTGIVADVQNPALEELTKLAPLSLLRELLKNYVREKLDFLNNMFDKPFTKSEQEENKMELNNNPISEIFLSFLKVNLKLMKILKDVV